MYGLSEQIPIFLNKLSSIYPDTHTNSPSGIGASHNREHTLDRLREPQRVTRRRKGQHEPIPERLDLPPTKLHHGCPDQGVVRAKHLMGGIVSQSTPQLRRTLDIREDDRGRSIAKSTRFDRSSRHISESTCQALLPLGATVASAAETVWAQDPYQLACMWPSCVSTSRRS